MVHLLAELTFFQLRHLPTRKARALVPQVLSPMGPNLVSFLSFIGLCTRHIVRESGIDDESSDADSKAIKEKLVKAKIDRKRKFERDSSRTLTSGNNSDAGKEELPVATEAEKVGKEKDIKKKKPKKQEKESDDSTSSSNDDSDSDSSSSHASTSVALPSSSESGDDASKTTKKIGKDKVSNKRKAQDDSSSDSEESDSDANSKMDEDSSVNAKPQPSLKKDATSNSEVQVTKRLRTSEDGAAVSTATTKENGTRSAGNGSGNNGKNGRKSNTPFQRFDPSKIPVHNVKDNRYEAKVCFGLLLHHSPLRE